MNKSILLSVGLYHITPLILVLALVGGWAAVALAQTSAEGQYGSPTERPSGSPAISGFQAGAPGVPKGEAPKGPGGDAGGAGGDAGGGGGGGAGGGAPGISVLPATGGPLNLLAALGALALGSTALLALRHVVRR